MRGWRVCARYGSSYLLFVPHEESGVMPGRENAELVIWNSRNRQLLKQDFLVMVLFVLVIQEIVTVG